MISIAMVVFSYYPADPRVRREAEALIDEGISVDVICLRNEGESARTEVNGVTVHRVPLRRKRKNKIRYLWEYMVFFLMAFFKVSILHVKKHFRIVHVHNMPDFLAFTALFPRITGTKVILDLHDPMPEVYMTKYDLPISHPIIRVLLLFEKMSISFSNLVLTPNKAFRDLFISRSCPEHKIHVVMNSPQEAIFHSVENFSPHVSQQGFTIMYHGTIVERHGLDIALDAMEQLSETIPGLKFHVYGDGDFVERFLELAEQKKMNEIVQYFGQVPLEQISQAITSIDVGIIPNKKTPFTEINLPTRIFEYLSIGKPVIVPKTTGILDYFNEDSLFYFESGNPESLMQTILHVYENPDKREIILAHGVQIYNQHRWERESRNFCKLVKNLLAVS